MKCPKCESFFNDSAKNCYICNWENTSAKTNIVDNKINEVIVENPKFARKNKVLITTSFIMMSVCMFTGVFYSFENQLFNKSNEVIHDVVELSSNRINNFLICDKTTSTSNSMVSINYVGGRIDTYDIKYDFNTNVVTDLEFNTTLKEFNELKKVVETFKDEAGFDYVITDEISSETQNRVLGLSYKITVDKVQNERVLALIKDINVSKDTKKANLELAGYICK